MKENTEEEKERKEEIYEMLVYEQRTLEGCIRKQSQGLTLWKGTEQLRGRSRREKLTYLHQFGSPGRSCQNKIRSVRDLLGETFAKGQREKDWEQAGRAFRLRCGFDTCEGSEEKKKVLVEDWNAVQLPESSSLRETSAGQRGSASSGSKPLFMLRPSQHGLGRNPGADPESVAAGGCQLTTLLTAAVRRSSEWHTSPATKMPFYVL